MEIDLDLTCKIKQKNATVGVLGIGYVGRPLAEAANSAGFKVIGFSRGPEKVLDLNNLKRDGLSATVDFSKLADCDVICICVPTPIYEDKTPDLRPLKNSLLKISTFMKKKQLIIIESSIAAGTTRKFALPLLNKLGLVEGKDFLLAFSPERIDPGNEKFNLKNTPKIVGGLDQVTTDLATLFYQSFIEKVVPVSSLETAEMAKILENTYRLVNISLINELAEYCRLAEIDIWEVISAASTKPFGFLPHYPGPGIGGHCIPVDPYYLMNDAINRGLNLRIVEQAGRVNDQQPVRVARKALEILKNMNGKNTANKILLMGVAYKPDIADVRESPAINIWEMLDISGAQMSYHDPYISHFNGKTSVDLSKEVIETHDLIIIVTNHGIIDYQQLLEHDIPILDTRNVLSKKNNPNVYNMYRNENNDEKFKSAQIHRV